ncbi:MAG TPA: serine hydrolase domain-containing protein [Nitriliruptorales bacterium]
MIGEADLQQLVTDLRERHGIPGAVAGVLQDGQRSLAGTGTANLASGVEMTPDTVFLLGSITKTWMGTMVMRLVDDGTLDLDAPVREYLPDFRLADEDLAQQVTVRHLVTHSSGIDAGDFILECGRNPDAVQRYVEALATAGWLHDPGRWATYNNAGYVVAGRIMEVIAGTGWDDVVRELLLEPLELTRTGLTADHAVLHRAAVGHFPSSRPDGLPQPTTAYMLPYSMGPAGATLVTSVDDVLSFAQLHLDQGVTPSGQRLLEPESVALMQTHQVSVPAPAGTGFGITWGRSERDGVTVLSHGGGSNGGRAMLYVIPERRFACVAFANHSQSLGFHVELARELTGGQGPATALDQLPEPRSGIDLQPYEGTYERWGLRTTVDADGDELVLTFADTDPSREWMVYSTGEDQVTRGRLVTPELLMVGEGASAQPFYFTDFDGDGRPGYTFSSSRLARRSEVAA